MPQSMSTNVELMWLTVEEFRWCWQTFPIKGQAVNILGFHHTISVATPRLCCGRPRAAMLLLLLSCFSRVWLCVTPQMAAHQAPPSLGFSRQEHWSGLPFPSPMHGSEKWKWSHRQCINEKSHFIDKDRQQPGLKPRVMVFQPLV